MRPDVNFQMPAGLGTEKRGLVTAFRYGLFAPGKSRIVLDVGGPFLIDKAFVLDARDDQPARLVVDLVPTDEKTFLAKLKETPSHEKANESPLPPQSVVRPPNAKPVVVLDPGHGGVDPGAKSAAGVAEKEVVLSFAKVLKTKLEATGPLRDPSDARGRHLPAAARARGLRAEKGRERVPVDPRRLLPGADRQDQAGHRERRDRLHALRGGL